MRNKRKREWRRHKDLKIIEQERDRKRKIERVRGGGGGGGGGGGEEGGGGGRRRYRNKYKI